MKKLILSFLCVPLFLSAQIYDDFNDGDFSANPVWKGSDKLFVVNASQQLQLYDTTENVAWLSTENSLINENEWRFWVKCSFSPSANNHTQIFLASDKEDISEALNGYYLQLGESGGDDAIELFRKDGETSTSLCRGENGLIASSFTLRIKVTRSNEGHWKVYADPSGDESFQLQSEATDNTYTSTAFVGLLCKYTKSNSTKFYFDDIYCGPVILDTSPPEVVGVKANSDSSLVVQFSEPVNPDNALLPGNYYVNQDIGFPYLVIQSSGNSVTLLFTQKFKNGVPYLLSISGIQDLAANEIVPAEIGFSFYKPQAFDIVFNEIMADPSPAINLPEVEYLELFNRTDQYINLENWTLYIGSSEKVFEPVTIDPGGYLVVGKTEAADAMKWYNPFYGFSSFYLTNSTQSLTLEAPDGKRIADITYSKSWYNDPEKQEGGWSLEQINPDNICSGSENWRASVDENGGSPGFQNSVFDTATQNPKVSMLELVDSNTIKLYFNQRMDEVSLSMSDHYHIDLEIGSPAEITIQQELPNLAILSFDRAFDTGIVYILTVDKSIQNCMGHFMQGDTLLYFGMSSKPGYNDIVINEILFNPWSNGVDYVEIFNRSQKIIDVSQLNLGSGKINPPNPIDTVFYAISERQQLMLPGDYLVLSSSSASVKEQYYTDNPDVFVQMEKFPTYTNEEGICLLASLDRISIDAFHYSEDMHYPLLNFTDGVALERTSPESPTEEASNWHSASELSGFGTPGYKNSQFVSHEIIAEQVSIEPEIFSPDNDGYNDVLSIKYNFDRSGYMLTLTVYNSAGQKVKSLVNNQYLGTSGFVNWDGIQDDNTKAPVGIYVLFVRVFDESGEVNSFKKTAVLASKL